MKIKNKKTGEINYGDLHLDDFESLAELNEEWEDYEEPETFWYMTAWGDVKEYSQDQFAIKQKQAIGNYFETEEEAEKAVLKLKAWKRLKDKGFRFDGIAGITNEIYFKANESFTHIMVDEYTADKIEKEYIDDLMLLFGGEE